MDDNGSSVADEIYSAPAVMLKKLVRKLLPLPRMPASIRSRKRKQQEDDDMKSKKLRRGAYGKLIRQAAATPKKYIDDSDDDDDDEDDDDDYNWEYLTDIWLYYTW